MSEQAPIPFAAAGATAGRRLYLLFRIAADRYALDAADVILLTWGTQGDKYAEQKEAALEVLKDYEAKVYCIECKGKGPIHPSRMSYDSEIVKVKIDAAHSMTMDLSDKL